MHVPAGPHVITSEHHEENRCRIWFTLVKNQTENTTVIEVKAEQRAEGCECMSSPRGAVHTEPHAISSCWTWTRHKPDTKLQSIETKTTVYIMLTKIQFMPHSIFRFRNKKILHVLKTLEINLFVRIYTQRFLLFF